MTPVDTRRVIDTLEGLDALITPHVAKLSKNEWPVLYMPEGVLLDEMKDGETKTFSGFGMGSISKEGALKVFNGEFENPHEQEMARGVYNQIQDALNKRATPLFVMLTKTGDPNPEPDPHRVMVVPFHQVVIEVHADPKKKS